MAYCWEDADSLPPCVKTVFKSHPDLVGLVPLLAIPEHQVPLPGGSRPSQNDLWVLAKGPDGLISIAVEGKVSEPFGPTVGEWKPDSSPGKRKRFDFLCNILGLGSPPDTIRYQLFHRTASAILEAQRFNAGQAIIQVHSFSQTNEWFEDFEKFIHLFRKSIEPRQVVDLEKRGGINLYAAWAKGEKRFLES